jgi:hypothetical protein
VLKGIGAGAVGAAGFAGTVSAWGKGISWVAFCGCETEEGDGSRPEDWIWGVCVEDGEITGVSYDASGTDCRVFFMSGGTIYEVVGDGQDGTVSDDNEVIREDAAEATDAHPSASSDPCSCVPTGDDPRGGPGGCEGGLDGYKFEVEESWKDRFIHTC